MNPVAGESAADYLRRMAVTRTNPTREQWQNAARVLDGIRFKSEPNAVERSTGMYAGEQATFVVIPVFMDDEQIGDVQVEVNCSQALQVRAYAQFRKGGDIAG